MLVLLYHKEDFFPAGPLITEVDPEIIFERLTLDGLAILREEESDESPVVTLAVIDMTNRMWLRVTVTIEEVLLRRASDDAYAELHFGGKIKEVLVAHKLLGYSGPENLYVAIAGLLFRARITSAGAGSVDDEEGSKAAGQPSNEEESYGDFEATEDWQLPLGWHVWAGDAF